MKAILLSLLLATSAMAGSLDRKLPPKPEIVDGVVPGVVEAIQKWLKRPDSMRVYAFEMREGQDPGGAPTWEARIDYAAENSYGDLVRKTAIYYLQNGKWISHTKTQW